MNDLQVLCELLGTDRVEVLKDYILNVMERDIEESVRDSYNYIISPDTFAEFGAEVFEEVKAELKKKYKKQLKGELELQILKVIDRVHAVIESEG